MVHLRRHFAGLQSRRRFLVLWFFVCIAAAPAPVSAQVFELDGGSSSLFQSSGGSLGVRSSTYGARVDFGLLQSDPRFGFAFTGPRWGYDWQAGDQNIPFVLPTDLFDHSYYFLGRGLGAERKTSKSEYFYFAGATSTGYLVPFMNAASPQTPAGVFFFEHKWNSKWKFYSRNILSQTQTSIQSVEWDPRRDMDVGFSGGLGSNEHYLAGSFRWSRDWATLRASYAFAGNQFRRITVQEPVLTEQDKENVQLDLTPMQDLRFTVARQNYLSPVTDSSAPTVNRVDQAAVNSFGAWGRAEGFELYGSLFLAKNSDIGSRAYALGTRHSLTSKMDLGVDYLATLQDGFAPQYSVIYSVREHVTPRIDLSQFIVQNNGQASVSYGGSFLASLFSVSADYQTMYFPLATPGQPPFRQILTLSIHLQLPNGVELNADTNVTPGGRVDYTTYGTEYLYGSYSGGAAVRSAGFYRNMVRGRVVDVQGNPVEGAAVLVGGQVAFTDSDGEFSVRFKRAREMKFEVFLDAFTIPGVYEVVSAPSQVRAVAEANAVNYKITVRRVSSTKPSQPLQKH